MANRARVIPFSAIEYVLSQQINSRRDPASMGVTVTPDASFTQPVSYRTMQQNYQGRANDVTQSLDAQASSKAIWQSLSLSVDKNNDLLFKIFNRAEQWSLLRAFYLADDLKASRPNTRSIATGGR
jgi:hypothetical protein